MQIAAATGSEQGGGFHPPGCLDGFVSETRKQIGLTNDDGPKKLIAVT